MQKHKKFSNKSIRIWFEQIFSGKGEMECKALFLKYQWIFPSIEIKFLINETCIKILLNVLDDDS